MNKLRIVSDKSQPKNFLEVLQNKILKRYTNSYDSEEPIVYEFTQDRALLHQYYLLREKMYRRVFNTDKFSGEEDVHDKLSHILIARRGRLCLGGCRLTLREGDEKWLLPLESENFKLRDLFDNLPLDKVKHGEISRFAIMEDNKEAEVFSGMCKIMHDKVTELGIQFLFAKSTFKLARNWRYIANSYGVKTTRICSEIEVPENPIHPEVKWYLTVSNLSEVNNTSESLEQTSVKDSDIASQVATEERVEEKALLNLVK